MIDSECRFRLMLGRAEGIGPVSFRRLLMRFGTAEAALAALPELSARTGGTRFAAPSADAIDRELAALDKLGGRMLVLGACDYPSVLADLPDAPVGIAVLGDAELLSRRAIAIVGSRNASINGLRMAEQLAAELAQSGLVVVSGLARGVDSAAHRGAMATGKTLAVVAGGLDVAYPPENGDLQRQIGALGALVSEASLGTEPQARHFPRRRRTWGCWARSFFA